jgi:hypothetical protein
MMLLYCLTMLLYCLTMLLSCLMMVAILQELRDSYKFKHYILLTRVYSDPLGADAGAEEAAAAAAAAAVGGSGPSSSSGSMPPPKPRKKAKQQVRRATCLVTCSLCRQWRQGSTR